VAGFFYVRSALARIRIAFDLDIEDGKEEVLKDALNEDRKKVTDFIKDVVIPNNSNVAELRAQPMGGEGHVCAAEEGFCSRCGKWPEKGRLARLPK
jgi:hypothetical protein